MIQWDKKGIKKEKDKTVVRRDYKKIDNDRFKILLKEQFKDIEGDNTNTLANETVKAIVECLDVVAPLKEMVIKKGRQGKQWFSDDVYQAIKETMRM